MEIESISPAAGRLPASGCFPAGRLPSSPAESRRNHPPEKASRRKTKNSSHLDSDSREANSRLLQSKAKEVSFSHLDGTKYHAMGAIGSGAYGVVCAALDKKTKEKVAIKKIPNAMEMSVIAKRTYREIKILRHFKHENIIGIKDILLSKEERTSKDADGAETKTTLANSLKDIYVVLDFMESDLHHIIHSKQVLSEEHFRFFIYQIFRALKFIHSAHVIHRDLKPSNILVNENCELKIGDFGMARGLIPLNHSASDASNFLTMYVSTRWYRAPELMLSISDYACGVDVWSVGCIFAEMIRRRQLFPGSSYIQQMKMIVSLLGSPSKELLRRCNSEQIQHFLRGLGQHPPVPLSKVFPDASADAVDLLAKILILDPGERISVDEALEHPFLAKYHNPATEPSSPKLFDFSFETTHLSKESLKAAMFTEIDVFKAEKSKRLTRKLRRGEIPLKPAMTYDELIGSSQTGTDAQSGTSSKSRCHGHGVVEMTGEDVAQQQQLRQSQQLQRQSQQPSPHQELVGKSVGSDVVTNSDLSLSVSNLELPEDVQMASAKSLNSATSGLMDVSASELVNDHPYPSHPRPRDDDDVKLLNPSTDFTRASNSSRSTVENSSAVEVKEVDIKHAVVTSFANNSITNNNNNGSGNSTKVVSSDTKALLKAKLLGGSLGNRPRVINNNNNSIVECESNPIKMTASLKFKEREEKRRRKKEKAIERKKKLMEKESKASHENHLTDDDLSMLRRWSQMIPTSNATKEPSEETSSEASFGLPPSVSYDCSSSITSVSDGSTLGSVSDGSVPDHSIPTSVSDYYSVIPSVSSDCGDSGVNSSYNLQPTDAADTDGYRRIPTDAAGNFSDYRDHVENSNSPPENFAVLADDNGSVYSVDGPTGLSRVRGSSFNNAVAKLNPEYRPQLTTYEANFGGGGGGGGGGAAAANNDEENRHPMSRGDPLISSAISSASLFRPLTISGKEEDSMDSLTRLLSRSAKLEEEIGDNPASKPAFPSLTPEVVVGAIGGGAYGVDAGVDLANFSHVTLNPLEGFLSAEMISSAFSSSASAEILSTPKLIDGWLDLQQELEERRQNDEGDLSLLEHELNQWARTKK